MITSIHLETRVPTTSMAGADCDAHCSGAVVLGIWNSPEHRIDASAVVVGSSGRWRRQTDRLGWNSLLRSGKATHRVRADRRISDVEIVSSDER